MIRKIKKILYDLNLIKIKHWFDLFVYVERNGNITNKITETIKWIDIDVCIKCKKKELNNKIKELENTEYIKYKGYINWF